MNNEIIKFNNGNLELDVTVTPDKDTVWLTVDQLCTLFNKNKSTISRHIKNIFNEGELDEISSVAKNATQLKRYDPRTGKDRISNVEINYYNLDVIISVGYRVKSQNGIIFRKWATSILKDYMIKGFAVNEKRLEALDKTIQIQSRMLASALNIEEKEVLNVIEAYSNALTLLDDYDHGTIPKPDGIASIYCLSYEECRSLIDSMKYGNFSSVFGVEKELGKLNGIIAAVYQNVFGTELYPSIEEKAANLLYFLIKDHPFVDGCKRIGASIFLEFLNKNKHLIIDVKQIISDSALVAITLMIAQSRPEEKETMVNLVMNFLKCEFCVN
ncbi:RhuM family protein [Holdemanella biformis]|uniref:Phosphoribosylaminoimidazolesuccinocarboxamide synthase n=1 Tax=Holdemanella biformis TaxID=1735 RepID=A0A412IXL8_9FIRM|nr:RhuM family protein [Holdemanella biformis]RGS44931.1 phosphoribosylaminoimidazolesuccinocarboxamide synthase [Holdemanella biformis]